jgi:hypothetical protein
MPSDDWARFEKAYEDVLADRLMAKAAKLRAIKSKAPSPLGDRDKFPG